MLPLFYDVYCLYSVSLLFCLYLTFVLRQLLVQFAALLSCRYDTMGDFTFDLTFAEPIR